LSEDESAALNYITALNHVTNIVRRSRKSLWKPTKFFIKFKIAELSCSTYV